MNKYLIIFSLIFLSSQAQSDQIFEANYIYNKEIELSISSFEASYVYTLVTYKEKKILAERIFENGFNRWEEVVAEKHVELTEAEYIKLRSLLDDALKFKVKDDVLVEDGTTWTLETTRYQWLKIGVSSPEHETESRGYQGLLALGHYMRALSR